MPDLACRDVFSPIVVSRKTMAVGTTVDVYGYCIAEARPWLAVPQHLQMHTLIINLTCHKVLKTKNELYLYSQDNYVRQSQQTESDLTTR